MFTIRSARPARRSAARPALACTAAALLLAACGSAPRAPAGAPAPTAAPAATTAQAPRPEPRRAVAPSVAASAPAPLATEQRWLTQWFEGTPVRITCEPDGSALRLAVPLAFSFDAASPAPKPGLQAVLDKLGQSLKRQPASRLRIAAPGPAARALAARKHLLVHGVAAHRVEAASSAAGNDVLLQLSLAPTPPAVR